MTNKNNRLKKFNELKAIYGSHPLFNKVKDLYLDGEIKTISSAEKRLKDIKYKKNGEIFKTSSSKLEKFNIEYKAYSDKYEIKKYVKDTKEYEIIININSSLIITSDKNYIINDDAPFYTLFIHYETIKNIIINTSDKLYIKHYIKLYEKGGARYDHDLKTFFFSSSDKSNAIYSDFLYNLTVDGSNFTPYISEFLKERSGRRAKLVFKVYKQIETTGKQYKYIQNYQDNATGTCVYDGLIKKFEAHEKGNGRKIYNTLIKNESIYKKAYTLEELKQIAEALKISITIKDLINGDNIDINLNKTNYYNITFINTRYNHLDLYTCENIQADEVKPEEYETIKKESLFYIERMGTLYTLEHTIKKHNTPFKLLFNSWKEYYNINSFSIDINGAPALFIDKYDDKTHRIFNKDMINDNNLYTEIDLKQAYYNYKGKIPTGAYVCVSVDDKGEYLKIDDFKEQIKNNLCGWYEVRIKDSNHKLNYLGFVVDSIHLIFTRQLEIILKAGAVVEILNYCVSPSIDAPFNIPLFNDMFIKYGDNLTDERQNKEPRAYQKAVGLLMIETTTTETNIKTDDKEFNKITDLKNNQTLHRTDEQTEYKIIEDINRPKSLKHIALAIHAYSASIILETILNNFENVEDVQGVKVDSIIFKKEAVLKINESLFKAPTRSKIECLLNNGGVFGPYFEPLNYNLTYIKKCKTYSDLDYGIIDESTEEEKDIIFYEEGPKKYNITEFEKSFIRVHIVSNIILIRGKGGSGKTHAAMTTKNFNNNDIVFTSSCWDLIQTKEAEHPEILGLSSCKLLGIQTEKYNIDNKKIIIADEITLNHKTDLEKMINENPTKIIILLGDIDDNGFYYQCSIGDDVIKPKTINNLQTVLFTKNYRFDETLNNKLDELRKIMRTRTTKENLFNYVKNEFKDNFKNKSDVIFNKNNFIGITALKPTFINNICSLSREYIQSDNINDYNIYVKQTNIYNNEMRGRLFEIREDKQYKNFEAGVFKTIHSYQGRQLEKDTETEKYKIIININSLFNYNLLYTAISRARTVEQIIIVDDRKNETPKKINPLLEKYKKEQQERTNKLRGIKLENKPIKKIK